MPSNVNSGTIWTIYDCQKRDVYNIAIKLFAVTRFLSTCRFNDMGTEAGGAVVAFIHKYTLSLHFHTLCNGTFIM